MIQTDPHVVLIQNARLSFPNIFKPKQGTDSSGQPSGEPKYSAVFLLDKVTNKDDIARLTTSAVFTKQEKWQGKAVNLTGKSIRDGSEKEATDGYGSKVVFVSAANTKRVTVVGRKLEPLVESDGKVYAGCYVNAELRCWAQDNGFGKRINWSLQKIQFVRDGEPFGEKQTPVDQAFKSLDDDTVDANESI